MNALQEALAARPEAKHLYETNPRFREEIDKVFAIIENARRSLSDEDYAEFLTWARAFAEEWT